MPIPCAVIKTKCYVALYRWKCSSNVSSPCIVIGKPLSGLESVLSEEEMRKPTLKIPAGYLPPGRLGITNQFADSG